MVNECLWEQNTEIDTCVLWSLYGTSEYVHPVNRCPTSAAIVAQRKKYPETRSPELPLQYICSNEFSST
jgi:hypothetical protein